jgi:tetratricopeptide (TPR) repeat protein
LLRRAAALNEAGQFAAAAEQLDALLAEDPQDTAARYQLARAQLGTGALDQAERNIGMVLAADPDDVGSLGMAAAVYSARGELGAARRAAAAAIRLTPDSPRVFELAAAIDLDADQVTDGTLANALRAVELDRNSADAQRMAGSALIDLKRAKEAEPYLRRALAIDPDDAAAIGELARWKSMRGRQASAASGYAQVLRTDPTDTAARNNLLTVTWRAFWLAQLVLWVTTVFLSRVRLLSGGDPGTWLHIVGPVAVVLTLTAWAFQLRGNWRGGRTMLTIVVSQRILLIGLTAHLLCLVAFACTLLPGGRGEAALIVGIALLLVATVCIWVRARQVKRSK